MILSQVMKGHFSITTTKWEALKCATYLLKPKLVDYCRHLQGIAEYEVVSELGWLVALLSWVQSYFFQTALIFIIIYAIIKSIFTRFQPYN